MCGFPSMLVICVCICGCCLCLCVHVWNPRNLNDTDTLTATAISVRSIQSQPGQNEDLYRKKHIPLLLPGSRPREPLLPTRRQEVELKNLRPAGGEIHARNEEHGNKGTDMMLWVCRTDETCLNLFGLMTHHERKTATKEIYTWEHLSVLLSGIVCIMFVLCKELIGAGYNQEMSPLLQLFWRYLWGVFFMVWRNHCGIFIFFLRWSHCTKIKMRHFSYWSDYLKTDHVWEKGLDPWFGVLSKGLLLLHLLHTCLF